MKISKESNVIFKKIINKEPLSPGHSLLKTFKYRFKDLCL